MTDAAPGAGVAPSAPTPPRRGGAGRRWIDRWVPAGPPPGRPDGYRSDPGPDRASLAVAIAMALAAAALFEYFASGTPIPPGGDEGTWLLLSYPYIGLPSPSQIQLLSYPPLTFPFLGLAVFAGGGPLAGARLFAGAVIVLLGVAMYQLGRALFDLRVVALFVEAAFLLQPDFQQLYYFGAYPNMVGFCGLFLTLAFALRFLRSRRPSHLLLFWTAACATVLAHALVGVVLVGLLGIAGLLLLLFRRLPRELFTGRAGPAGLAAFAVSIVGYYGGSVLLGANPPNYLATTVLTASKSTLALPAVLRPFYLEPLATFLRGSGFPLTYLVALQILWELLAAVLAVLFLVRALAPERLRLRHLLVASWFLAVVGLALLTWYLGLAADYRRFAYFLYPVLLAVLGLGADAVLRRLRPWLRARPVPAPSPAGRTRRWRLPGGPRRGDLVYAGILAVAAVGLLVAADLDTVPSARGYAAYFTRVGHDAQLVSVLRAVADSGIPGSILSVTPVVDRWPATLTGRNLYEARPPTGFTYSSENLVQDELAYLAAHYRYTATNGLVLAAVPGVGPLYRNATPVYALYDFGVVRPVFQLAPANLFVAVDGAAPVPVGGPNGSATLAVLPPASGGLASFGLRFTGPGYVVNETVTAVPGTDRVDLDFVATANGSTGLTGLRVKLVSATGSPNAPSAAPGGFAWSTNTTAGNFTTLGTPTVPGTSVGVVAANATTGRGGSVNLSVASTGPVASLHLAVSAASPGATNTATGIGGFYAAPAIWASWDARFALLWNGTNATGPGAAAYLINEYGATVFVARGPWTILLLPTVAPAAYGSSAGRT